MMKTRLAVAAALILAGGIIASPAHTSASSATGPCAAGASPSKITPVYMTYSGKATNAMPFLYTLIGPGGVPMSSVTSLAGVPATSTLTSTTIVAPMAYGLINYIAGINPAFIPNAENELSEFFTFSSVASTVQDMTAGAFNISSRSGTFTLYLGHGSWVNPATFSNGMPILTASFTEQIQVANTFFTTGSASTQPGGLQLSVVGAPTTGTNVTATGSFTTMSSVSAVTTSAPSPLTFASQGKATVTASTPFMYGGTCYQLGSVGQTLTMTATGQFDDPSGPSGAYNGALTSS